MTINGTIAKAVIATLSAFAASITAHTPIDSAQWIQAAVTALAAGGLVWYVPNGPKSGGTAQ